MVALDNSMPPVEPACVSLSFKAPSGVPARWT